MAHVPLPALSAPPARPWSRRWGPVLAMMAVIFAFSSREIPARWRWVPDWISHPAEYGVLGALVARARGRRGAAGVLAVVAFCGLYGVTDEFHQSFVPTRNADPWDVGKDLAGGALGALAWLRITSGQEEANR